MPDRDTRMSPNVVYVGDPTGLGERVVAVSTGARRGIAVVEDADGQRLAVALSEVYGRRAA